MSAPGGGATGKGGGGQTCGVEVAMKQQVCMMTGYDDGFQVDGKSMGWAVQGQP